MAHPLIPEPNSEFEDPGAPAADDHHHLDLEKLVAKFSAHAGAGMSRDVAVQLALEVILNEIVEEACGATGAGGAAVILERAGELVCRAASGDMAPELGARFSHDSSLTAECVRTQQTQLCNDTQSDPRADAEACRTLGVRSVMVVPVVSQKELAGVLEVFSPQPGAFGLKDEVMLMSLARRIAANLERASQPFEIAKENAGLHVVPVPERPAEKIAEKIDENPLPSLGPKEREKEREKQQSPELEDLDGGDFPQEQHSRLTLALTAAVAFCALLLATLIGIRVGWIRATHHEQRRAAAASVPTESPHPAPSQAGAVANSPAISTPPAVPPLASAPAPVANIAPGSLVVYEGGKEVFREGSPAAKVAADVAPGSVVRRVEPDYPESARQQKIQGPVVLDVRVGRDGRVQDVQVTSGPPILAESAVAAVKQWQFQPKRVNGQPVEMQTQLTLTFRLPQ